MPFPIPQDPLLSMENTWMCTCDSACLFSSLAQPCSHAICLCLNLHYILLASLAAGLVWHMFLDQSLRQGLNLLLASLAIGLQCLFFFVFTNVMIDHLWDMWWNTKNYCGTLPNPEMMEAACCCLRFQLGSTAECSKGCFFSSFFLEDLFVDWRP